jgi:hypothetical protein
LSSSEEFRISTFLVIIDSFLLDLRKRIKAYTKVDELFSFLRHTDVETDVSLNGVVDFYIPEDLEDVNAFENEWFQWRSLLKNVDVTFCSPSEMLKFMVRMISVHRSQTPTFLLVSRYLALPVKNCTSPVSRSFSHIKRIKSALRSTQAQERLNNLSLLNIEGELLQELEFSTVIDAFTSTKCRKRSFFTARGSDSFYGSICRQSGDGRAGGRADGRKQKSARGDFSTE